MSRRLACAAVVLAAACAMTPVPGTYEAVLPAASEGGERHVRVTLKPDGFGALSSAFSGRPSRFLAEGTWEGKGNRITMTFADGKTMAFEHAGDELIAREWDRAAWGEAGPGVLYRVR